MASTTRVFPNYKELQTFLTANPTITIDGFTGWHGLVLVYH